MIKKLNKTKVLENAPTGIRTRVFGSKGRNDWPDYTIGAYCKNGPNGVRTHGRPVMSRALYLAKLWAQNISAVDRTWTCDQSVNSRTLYLLSHDGTFFPSYISLYIFIHIYTLLQNPLKTSYNFVVHIKVCFHSIYTLWFIKLSKNF